MKKKPVNLKFFAIANNNNGKVNVEAFIKTKKDAVKYYKDNCKEDTHLLLKCTYQNKENENPGKEESNTLSNKYFELADYISIQTSLSLMLLKE